MTLRPGIRKAVAPVLASAVTAAILVGGLCGGLIGYGFTDLQCEDGCTAVAGGMGLLGAVDLVRRVAPGMYVGIGFRTSGEPLGPIFGASAFLLSGPTRPWVPFDQPTT